MIRLLDTRTNCCHIVCILVAHSVDPSLNQGWSSVMMLNQQWFNVTWYAEFMYGSSMYYEVWQLKQIVVKYSVYIYSILSECSICSKYKMVMPHRLTVDPTSWCWINDDPVLFNKLLSSFRGTVCIIKSDKYLNTFFFHMLVIMFMYLNCLYYYMG